MRTRIALASRLLLLMTSVGACTRPAPSSTPPTEQKPGLVGDRTVFTDSALFRRVCAEADSGLSPRAGRCTPRDQAVRIP